jgi:hypothetical protein
VVRIDFEHWLGVADILPGGFQDPREVQAHTVLMGNETGR